MVRWEAVIIALFGTLLGIALALFFGWAVVDALHDQGFTKFSAAPVSLIIIVVITGVATLGWASLPARRAVRRGSTLLRRKAVEQDQANRTATGLREGSPARRSLASLSRTCWVRSDW